MLVQFFAQGFLNMCLGWGGAEVYQSNELIGYQHGLSVVTFLWYTVLTCVGAKEKTELCANMLAEP